MRREMELGYQVETFMSLSRVMAAIPASLPESYAYHEFCISFCLHIHLTE